MYYSAHLLSDFVVGVGVGGIERKENLWESKTEVGTRKER